MQPRSYHSSRLLGACATATSLRPPATPDQVLRHLTLTLTLTLTLALTQTLHPGAADDSPLYVFDASFGERPGTRALADECAPPVHAPLRAGVVA